eukprot:5446969-Amphidinium_carterae.1
MMADDVVAIGHPESAQQTFRDETSNTSFTKGLYVASRRFTVYFGDALNVHATRTVEKNRSSQHLPKVYPRTEKYMYH